MTASVGGASTSATTAAVSIAIIRPASCPQPTGQLKGTTLGPIALGLTRTRARQMLPCFDVRSYHTDNFCLSGGWGIRVGYASTRLLRAPSGSHLAKLDGKIILALTGNPAYALRGVRQGTPLAAAARQLKLGKAIHWGLNDWYVVPAAAGNGVLKVRHRSTPTTIGRRLDGCNPGVLVANSCTLPRTEPGPASRRAGTALQSCSLRTLTEPAVECVGVTASGLTQQPDGRAWRWCSQMPAVIKPTIADVPAPA